MKEFSCPRINFNQHPLSCRYGTPVPPCSLGRQGRARLRGEVLLLQAGTRAVQTQRPPPPIEERRERLPPAYVALKVPIGLVEDAVLLVDAGMALTPFPRRGTREALPLLLSLGVRTADWPSLALAGRSPRWVRLPRGWGGPRSAVRAVWGRPILDAVGASLPPLALVVRNARGPASFPADVEGVGAATREETRPEDASAGPGLGVDSRAAAALAFAASTSACSSEIRFCAARSSAAAASFAAASWAAAACF
mmetsp:Transcript_333/g.894  ORF Transcript_333/g.894 Transcript_333/m.894 type:complete len:252 (-) Transcript_333:660-1415(-)